MSDRSAVITVPVEKWGGWDFRVLLTADQHHDNEYSRHDLQKKHLDMAREYSAPVLGMGDMFDAMQSASDKRQSKSELRAANKVDAYWDSLVDELVEFHVPYAHLWAYAGEGNHESKARKQFGVGLVDSFCRRMRTEHNSCVLSGLLNNWVLFRFIRGTECFSRKLWWHHGYAGGGQVTQDFIQGFRQRTYIVGADLMVSSHVHRAWMTDVVVESLDSAGKPELKTVWLLKIPTYKDAYGKGGFDDEHGFDPRPLGAWFVRFYWDGHRVELEPTRAR
jgi:hypothetical protein